VQAALVIRYPTFVASPLPRLYNGTAIYTLTNTYSGNDCVPDFYNPSVHLLRVDTVPIFKRQVLHCLSFDQKHRYCPRRDFSRPRSDCCASRSGITHARTRSNAWARDTSAANKLQSSPRVPAASVFPTSVASIPKPATYRTPFTRASRKHYAGLLSVFHR